jgi:hypothetical protein
MKINILKDNLVKKFQKPHTLVAFLKLEIYNYN